MSDDLPASPPANGSDPADSLRAAALLTLKAKRRKPTVDTNRQPPTDASLQLDYGQDDIDSFSADVPMPTASLALKPDPEDPNREEGEISDSEEAQASKLLHRDTPTLVKVESPTHDFLDRIRAPPPLSLGEQLIDADHVRPGLSMNQDQYDTAKDIVLDLLGWGVPPDYLVDCNLSREIVFYVFTELNLRLPHNLDVAGLIPYTPAHVALYSRPLSAAPPPRSEVLATPSRLHHPSLPPKPLAGSTAGPSSVQRSTAPSPPHHPSSPPIDPSSTNQPPAAGTLHDMERQRRQELLARKAVQASRKVKPPSEDASSIASSSYAPADPLGVPDQDVEMPAAMLATDSEAVDDFLKTIGEKSVTPEALIQPEAPDNTMDVDEIPGLGDSTSASTSYGAAPDASLYTEQVVISPAESSFSAAQMQQHDPPPTSGESGSSSSSITAPAFGMEQAAVATTSTGTAGAENNGRRRPDFVDFDSGSRNGHGHGNGHHHVNPLIRRKTASFGGVSGHRKLVIDLSDSEGEGGEDYAMHEAEWDTGSGYNSPAPGVGRSAAPVGASGGGWATPPTGSVMTPAALVEKEQEIRKMREMIAQREMSRKQKAMSRTSSTVADLPRHEEGANGSSHRNGYHPDGNGTIAAAIVEKRALIEPSSSMAGSASGARSTSASATPPHIDSYEEMGDGTGASINGHGAQDSDSAMAATASQDYQPVTNGSGSGNGTSVQEPAPAPALQEPVAGPGSGSRRGLGLVFVGTGASSEFVLFPLIPVDESTLPHSCPPESAYCGADVTFLFLFWFPLRCDPRRYQPTQDPAEVVQHRRTYRGKEAANITTMRHTSLPLRRTLSCVSGRSTCFLAIPKVQQQQYRKQQQQVLILPHSRRRRRRYLHLVLHRLPRPSYRHRRLSPRYLLLQLLHLRTILFFRCRICCLLN
ncbi:hypothetical protein B0H16DRAFT_1681862 [Mycena metata]|uniref:Uncharacterized protein n=1 Tax=Mycena metata TaxID=1033252 RepID=A0AAD7KFF3_9AGAR|nr:hypothetical protein B0H16DRAFT_1681862 [Mycena metata]